ncbi:hypothetical protein GQ53DRAFT_727723 [Thozetella sp. PMI_491]|nr:hypothetical protein GQ53DRAFT_727723 [Thozetella sp. PMI_491]
MRGLFLVASLAASAAAAANCSREFLATATDAYVKAQAAGAGGFAVLANNVTYRQNERLIPVKSSLLSQPLKLDHNRSIYDTVECRTFTELIVTDPKAPYVVATRMLFDGPKVSEVESLVTTTGDWAFNATGYLHWDALEHWEPIPVGKRDSRAVIQAAGDAYFNRFLNVNVTVPWGVPCARLEGGAYTGSRNLTIDSCSPAGMPSNIRVTNRRYVVDEVMGVVDIFLGFPGLDRSEPHRPTPDSHLFRVESGKIRYIHTVSPCFQAGCGMKNSTIPMRRARVIRH